MYRHRWFRSTTFFFNVCIFTYKHPGNISINFRKFLNGNSRENKWHLHRKSSGLRKNNLPLNCECVFLSKHQWYKPELHFPLSRRTPVLCWLWTQCGCNSSNQGDAVKSSLCENVNAVVGQAEPHCLQLNLLWSDIYQESPEVRAGLAWLPSWISLPSSQGSLAGTTKQLKNKRPSSPGPCAFLCR